MKKLFTLVLLFCSLQSFSQLTLVRKTELNLWPIQLSSGKWIFQENTKKNGKLQSIKVYNDDYTTYKVVNINQTFPYDTTGFLENSINLNDLTRVDGNDNNYDLTDNFFNTDNKIELIISYQSSNNLTGKKKCTTIIIDEDGNEIFRIINEQGNWISFYYWKYLSIVIGNEETNSTIQTHIYSVPGNLPCPFTCSQKAASIAPISQPNEFKEIQVTGFPNPSSEKVTLAYSLPEGTQFGTLRLYTQTGELVKEFKVSNQVDHLELPVSEYNAGTYFYELQAGGSSSGGKKMVVIH
jgi:hypothetical protein